MPSYSLPELPSLSLPLRRRSTRSTIRSRSSLSLQIYSAPSLSPPFGGGSRQSLVTPSFDQQRRHTDWSRSSQRRRPGSWWSDFVSSSLPKVLKVATDVYKEVNGRGTFLVTQGFLKHLGKEKKGTVGSLTTEAAVSIFPRISSYSISKLIHIQLAAYVAAENPNVTSVALHPGTVKTDMTLDSFVRFSVDTPELVGVLEFGWRPRRLLS